MHSPSVRQCIVCVMVTLETSCKLSIPEYLDYEVLIDTHTEVITNIYEQGNRISHLLLEMRKKHKPTSAHEMPSRISP
jgi:hypothetical protein